MKWRSSGARGEVPVSGSADAAGEGQQGAHDQLTAADALPLCLQLGRAAGHEHVQLRREVAHPGVERSHRPAFERVLRCPRGELPGALGRLGLGERGGEYLLHDRHGAGELERLLPGVLATTTGLRYRVPA
jgi:hypothetical protein